MPCNVVLSEKEVLALIGVKEPVAEFMSDGESPTAWMVRFTVADDGPEVAESNETSVESR